MSELIAPVIPVSLIKHENADTLSYNLWNGYSMVVRSSDWIDIGKGIFIYPDNCVKTSRPEFSFLGPKELVRIKAKKLRGVWSTGLLIPAPKDAVIGDNYYDQLELIHYEPELALSTGGENVKGPASFASVPKFDIENGRSSKYRNLFTEGEMVYCSEKLHGCFCAVTCYEDKFYVKSRNEWKLETEDSLFWNAVKRDLNVFEFCKNNQQMILMGENYGQVQKGFKYDIPSGVGFRAFDIRRQNGEFLNYNEFVITCNLWNVPRVPEIGVMPFNFELLCELAEQNSLLGDGVSEGIVVKSIKERYDAKLGRCAIKLVSNRYLEKS